MRIPKLSPQLLADLFVFDEVVRLGSYSKAAAALNVTSPAVMRRIRKLSDLFEAELIQIHDRQCVPTQQGQAVLEAVMDGLQIIRSKWKPGREDTLVQTELVTIVCAVTLGGLWLGPRLPALEEDLGGKEVRMMVRANLDLVMAQEADWWLRYGSLTDQSAQVACSVAETIFPVAAPNYWASLGGSFERACLIHDTNPFVGADDEFLEWHTWSARAGWAPVPDREHIRVDMSTVAYLAAAHGAGIAIGKSWSVQPYLQNGTLVRVGECITTGWGYELLPMKLRHSTAASLVGQRLVEMMVQMRSFQP